MKIDELNTYQPEIIQLLQNAKKKDKLVHAYLFSGDSGSGMIEMALYFAMMLLCKEEVPCLKCNTCERIMYNSHMNVVTIEPINDVIRKEQIENLMHDFSLTALEEGPQIYIIKDADKMNAAASNALLKFLEEPAKEHYAVLVTTNYKKVLDTIVSRCQYIHFKPTSRKFIVDQLISNGVEKDIAYIISHITQDLSDAKKLIEEGKLVLYYNLAKKIVLAPFKKKDQYLEYYLNKNLLIKENDKSWHWIFLDILILMNQELYKKADNVSDIYFKNIFNQIKIEQLNKDKILKDLEILNKYEERLNYNVSMDLFYSSLFIEL
jgi:DNA polymerase-3 subunit delta'